MSEDDLPVIMKDGIPFARALTPKDGETIVEQLNLGAAGMRDQILDAVTDAIEQTFERK